MTLHTNDNNETLYEVITESTSQQFTLTNPVIVQEVETVAGATAVGTATELNGYGISVIASTISGSTGFYTLPAPVAGHLVDVFCTAASSTTKPSQVWTDSTGVFVQSTGGSAYRTISFGKDGGYCRLAAVSTILWAFLGGSADCVLGTT
jgi:hypothetical protein